MPQKKSLLAKLWQHFLRRIFGGIIVIIPISLTFIILRWVFNFVDGLFGPTLREYLRYYTGWKVPGTGFVLMIILLYFVGLLSANILGKKIIQFFDRLLVKTPIVNFVYKTIKQIVDTLSVSQRNAFKKVVLVSLLGSDVKVLGFVTGESLDKEGGKYIQVFVPTTPNPTSGYLEFVRPDQVVETKLTVEEAIKIVLSGGVITPERIN